MIIREATISDAQALADLHSRNLPDTLSDFTQLGNKIITRFYRQAIARGVGAAICAEDEEGLAGYVFVTRDVGVLFSSALLRNVRDIFQFLVEVRLTGLAAAIKTKASSSTLKVAAAPEVVYLVVDPRSRGQKLGSTLLQHAEQWFKLRHVRFYQLNARADNESAPRTYVAAGHQIVESFLKNGVLYHTLQKQL